MDFSTVIDNNRGRKSQVARHIASISEQLLELSRTIHDDPELSFDEHRASASICSFLENNGFTVDRGVAGLDTAFIAVAGDGPFTVGVCVEYDALPNIGHACGHNIIMGASVGAAIGLLPLAEELGITIKVIGTPAEEHGAGKALLLERGVFDDVTIAMMIHPMQDGLSYNPAGSTSQAVGRYRATFRGRASHAANAPHLGINAADAAIVTQVAVGLLRQQIPSDHRVAMYIAQAGEATNIIPELAIVEFECRSFTLKEYEVLLERVRQCFEAGALATGASLEIEPTEPLYEPLLQDETMSASWSDGMAFFGHNVERAPGPGGGSTDMGNVSRIVPSIHPWISIPGATSPPHSRGFAEAADSPQAYDLMFESAMSMAWMIVDITTDSATAEQYLEAAKSRRATTNRGVLA